MTEKFDPNLYDLCKILQAVEDLTGRPSLGKDRTGEKHIHPNYYHVWQKVPLHMDEVIYYLRLAEKLGYLKGYGGFYNGAGGGSKRWKLIRYPNSIEIIRGLDTIRGLTK